MYRPAAHCLSRQPIRIARQIPSRRFLSTAPPHQKSRSFRNNAVRLGVAGAGIYWYNTSPLFVDEPALLTEAPQPDDASLPTLASLSPSARFTPPTPENAPTIPLTPSSSSPPSIDPKAPVPTSVDLATPTADTETPIDASPEALEEEAHSQGAFNEETGEINWDCPCLGGMAHGPCGSEFREAFSCFVFSKEEPKGMDCIDRFKGMQECFRQHPDIYGAELDEDEADEEAAGAAGAAGAMPEDVPAVAAAEGEAIAQLADARAGEDAPAEAKASAIADEVAKSTAARESRPEKKSIYDSEDEREAAPASKANGAENQDKTLPDRSAAKGSLQALGEEEEVLPKAAHDATGPADK